MPLANNADVEEYTRTVNSLNTMMSALALRFGHSVIDDLNTLDALVYAEGRLVYTPQETWKFMLRCGETYGTREFDEDMVAEWLSDIERRLLCPACTNCGDEDDPPYYEDGDGDLWCGSCSTQENYKEDYAIKDTPWEPVPFEELYRARFGA